MRSGGFTAGSSRALRLDPHALPVRYAASDAAADERVRHIELHRERIVVRRAVRGMRMALNMPVSAFLGVSVRLLPPDGAALAAVAVMLEHVDPALALPLFVSAESTDIAAEWRSWSCVLGLPLLVEDLEGGFREIEADRGAAEAQTPAPRRQRHSPLKGRRPSFLARRKAGRIGKDVAVHRDEREIVARD